MPQSATPETALAKQKSLITRYFWAVSITAAALGVRLLLDPVLGFRIAYATFFIAVAISAVVGGWGPGVVSALLGGLAAVYFILPPRHHVLTIQGAENQLGFALYIIVSAMLIILAEMQNRARRRAESELARRQRSEADERYEKRRFEVTLDSIGDGVIATDADGRITFINKSASQHTEWKAADAIGRRLEDVFILKNEDTNAPVESPAIRAMRDSRRLELENHHVLLTHTGKTIPIGDSGAPIIDGAGRTRGGVLVFRDVSEQRTRDANLRRLKRMIDLSQDAIIVTDRERRVCSWNLGAKEMYGWDSAEACGEVIHVLLHTPASDVEKGEQGLKHDGMWEGELDHVHKDGREIRCESRQVLLLDADQNTEGLLEINRDITERRRIEEKLRERAKLESLGVLAGGIAHDFNNLLTGVLGYASILLDDAPTGSKNWQFAKGICESAERAAKLAQQMLAFSGRGQFVIESLNLSESIRQRTALIESSVPKNVKLVFDLANDIPAIEADASQLEQLVLNLVVNAAEAIGEKQGRLTIATRTQLVDEAYRRTLLLDEHVEVGQYVVLQVSDTGSGMDEETQARIFDPFFTTKFVGRGLGLAAVQGIVRGHKGAIKVASRAGEGTTLQVFLPAIGDAAAAHLPHVADLQDTTADIETILVIDDEEVVRSTADSALRRLGYNVITAADGSRGVELLREQGQSIRLVLLDLSMPEVSGEETMREIRKIRPDVPVVLSSGYSEAYALRGFQDQMLAGFLQKPYTGRALALRVREAIGRAESLVGR
jgi:two-component system, cell cycle sensor histidine kinase and response regulator CckA